MYIGGADDELTVHTHKTLRVELALNFFEGHVNRVMPASKSAEADNAIADGNMAHVAHMYDEIFVSTMRDQKAFAIADGLTLYGGQELRDGIGCRGRIDNLFHLCQGCMKFLIVDGFQQIVDAVEPEGLYGIVVVGRSEDDGDGFRHGFQLLETESVAQLNVAKNEVNVNIISK